MKFERYSIKRVGLRKHLDTTTHQHNGFDAEDFDRMVKAKVNPANMARAFGVDRKTMVEKWLPQYWEERERKFNG